MLDWFASKSKRAGGVGAQGFSLQNLSLSIYQHLYKFDLNNREEKNWLHTNPWLILTLLCCF